MRSRFLFVATMLILWAGAACTSSEEKQAQKAETPAEKKTSPPAKGDEKKGLSIGDSATFGFFTVTLVDAKKFVVPDVQPELDKRGK